MQLTMHLGQEVLLSSQRDLRYRSSNVLEEFRMMIADSVDIHHPPIRVTSDEARKSVNSAMKMLVVKADASY